MESNYPREYGVITVRDILQFALPDDTVVAAGEAGLGKDVTWATRLRATLPAFAHIAGGELVILDPAVLEMIDENLSLATAVRQLSGFGVSLIAAAGPTDHASRMAAEAAGLPLVELPGTSDLGQLERTAARSIAERRRELLAKGQEAGRLFMDIAIGGEPLSTLAEELVSISGRTVMIERADGSNPTWYPDASESFTEQQAQSMMHGTHHAMNSWLRSVASSSSAEPPVHGWTDNSGWTQLVAPVTGRVGLLGNISLFVPAKDERPEDTILLSRAASAAAVTLAQELATSAARREVELNVLDELLDGALRSEVALAQQAERLGHDLGQSFVAFVARAEQGMSRSRDVRIPALETSAHAFLESLNQSDVLWRVRNANVEVVLPQHVFESAPGIGSQLQAALTESLGGSQPGDRVSVGIGRVGEGMTGIRRSHQDARQALTLGRRLHGPGHVTNYDDLGTYRLILSAEQLPELRVFLEESLGVLLDYDRNQNGNLVQTLEAFFAANCSPKEASTLLGVHRNTVLYRLERISEITQLNLDDPDVRLRLHLALYVRTALGV